MSERRKAALTCLRTAYAVAGIVGGLLMAPIHHHYEKKGWVEPQIVIRFWIISLILAMIGLATLKVR